MMRSREGETVIVQSLDSTTDMDVTSDSDDQNNKCDAVGCTSAKSEGQQICRCLLVSLNSLEAKGPQKDTFLQQRLL